MKAEYFVGVDLGQSRDYTALAVVERVEMAGDWDAATFTHRIEAALRLRYTERVPLGTSYPEVVKRVGRVMRSGALAAGTRHLVVDATGVGRPVVDLLRQEIRAQASGEWVGGIPVMAGWCRLWPVVITGGDAEGTGGGCYYVPKRDLVVGLQVLMQQGGLQIASGLREGAALVREMAEVRVRTTGGGREQYGVWKDGEHDDLVLALGLACWAVKKTRPAGGTGFRGRLV